MTNIYEYWWQLLALILLLPVVSIVGFGFWIKSKQLHDYELTVKSWDVFIKLISALTVIIAGAMIFAKYIDQKVSEQRSAAIYRHNEFINRKITTSEIQYNKAESLLTEAARIATRIAKLETPSERDVLRFHELYYADLIGVEKNNGPVEKMMVCFRKRIDKEQETPECRPLSTNAIVLKLSEAVNTELDLLKKEISKLESELLTLSPLQTPPQSQVQDRRNKR